MGDILRNWNPKIRRGVAGLLPVCGYLLAPPAQVTKLDNLRVKISPASCLQVAYGLGGDVSELKNDIGL